MKIKPYKEIKHIFMMNYGDLDELNKFTKEYFGLDNIKDIHIYFPDGIGGIQADIICLDVCDYEEKMCKRND